MSMEAFHLSSPFPHPHPCFCSPSYIFCSLFRPWSTSCTKYEWSANTLSGDLPIIEAVTRPSSLSWSSRAKPLSPPKATNLNEDVLGSGSTPSYDYYCVELLHEFHLSCCLNLERLFFIKELLAIPGMFRFSARNHSHVGSFLDVNRSDKDTVREWCWNRTMKIIGLFSKQALAKNLMRRGEGRKAILWHACHAAPHQWG